jgi:hypothetical protein
MNPNPKPRVSLAFVRQRIAILIAFCRQVVTMLTGNPNFTTAFPALPVVTTAIDSLETANGAAMGGDRVDISVRRSAKAELLSLMRQLASYVQSHGGSDRTVLLSSGFDITKAPEPFGPVATPLTPVVRQGQKTGELRAGTQKVAGAYAYNFRLALASDPTVFLQTVQTTKSRAAFEDLTPGQTYIVQVNALGTAGASSWSGAGSWMVI